MHLKRLLLAVLMLGALLVVFQPAAAEGVASWAGGTQPAVTWQATPTPLPVNPAAIGGVQISMSIVQGVVITLILFALFGIYLGIRKLLRAL